jgi:predicted  nucleic acid-binding Zn-ribbon protein
MTDSLQKSYTALDGELSNHKNRIHNIGSNPTPEQSKELHQMISLLSDRLSKIKTEKSNILMEKTPAEASSKVAVLSAHGDEIMKTISNATNTLRDKNIRLRAEQENLVKSVDEQRKILSSNQTNFTNYTRDLQDKMELLATRDRMLQLSQERNVYKKKVIYVLFSFIIALLVAIIATYTFFNKQK